MDCEPDKPAFSVAQCARPNLFASESKRERRTAVGTAKAALAHGIFQELMNVQRNNLLARIFGLREEPRHCLSGNVSVAQVLRKCLNP